MALVAGAQLRAARALLRLEQEELAKAAGISANTIRKLENSEGRLEGRLSTIRALQHALEQAGIEFQDEGRPGVRMRAMITA
jgi:transcriptional regulator with XRE-family HTH domain